MAMPTKRRGRRDLILAAKDYLALAQLYAQEYAEERSGEEWAEAREELLEEVDHQRKRVLRFLGLEG